MPSRNSKGQFISDTAMSITLPGFTGLYKILFIAVLVFPWYVIISNRNISATLFGYIIGQNFTGCPPCKSQCSVCPNNNFDQTKFEKMIKDSFTCPSCECQNIK